MKSTVGPSSLPSIPSTPASDSSDDPVPRNSPALALIDPVVDIVTLAEIRNETKFRLLKEAIFKIADNQIELYNRLTNGEEEWESDDEDVLGSDDDYDGQSDVGSDHSDTTDIGTDVQNEDFTAPPTVPKDPRVLKGYLFQLDQFRLCRRS